MTRSIKQVQHIMVVIFLMLVSSVSYSQMSPSEEYDFYKSLYPEETGVYIQKKETVDYSIVNDSIKTSMVVYEELLHLSENTVRFASDKIYSSSFYKISEIEAYTLVPGKRKYERIDVTDFKESYDKDSDVFFDDSKAITFTYPAIQKGVKTVLKYKKTIQDPRLVGMFFFNTYIPVHKASYTIKHDPAITLNPQLFNTENIEIKTEKRKSEDNRLIVSHTANKLARIKFDRNCPSYNYIAATVYIPISKYTLQDGTTKELLSSPESLHMWYRTFVEKILEKNEEVKTLVDSIIEPDDSVLEKVRKIYYWVQSNIKYIAFEDGMRGLVPHPGDYVITKRYGDCKDMSSSIVSMLREAGIDAHYTWIGSRDLPYKYSLTPSPITDNHMIATFIHEGQTYFLDATGQYTPIGLPTSMIQGKECLISLGPEEFTIEEVPVVPKEMNIMTDSVSISLKDGAIQGQGFVSLTGYAKVFNTYRLIKANQKNVEDYLKRLLSKGSNKFELEKFTASNVEDLAKPIGIDYTFNIANYYRQIGDNIYVNLVLDKTMTDAILDKRTVPLENEYKYINRSIVNLRIPEGFSVSSFPENQSQNNDDFGYTIRYDVTDSNVVVTKEFYVDYLLLQPEKFETWNHIIAEYAKACRNAITLSNKPD